MRQALSVALIAGVAAQLNGQAPQPAPAPFPFQLGGQQGGQQGGMQFAQPAPSPSGAQVKGLPVITSSGLTDSDIACARGDFSMCGLPNIASIVNPNPGMQYQTQASDDAFKRLFDTGLLAADGRRVVTGNAIADQRTNVLPYWTTGSPFGNNVQGTITVAAGDATRTPLNVNIQAITSDPSAPNAFTPSASNQYLPQSSAYQFANLFPQFTTAPNKLTSAGIGYSTGINTQLGQTNVATPVNVGLGGVWGPRNPQVWSGPLAGPTWNAGAQWNAVPQWPQGNVVPQWPQGNLPPQWNTAPQWNAGTQWNNVPQWNTVPQWNAGPQWGTGLPNWGTSTIGAPAFRGQFATAPTVNWNAPAGTNGIFTNPGSFATAWNAPNAQQVNFAANAAANLPGTTLTTAPAWQPANTNNLPTQAGQGW